MGERIRGRKIVCSSRYREWQKEVDFADGGRGVDAILCPPAKFSERRCSYASVKRVVSELRMDGSGDSAKAWMVVGFVRNL